MAVVHWVYGVGEISRRGGYGATPSRSCRTIPPGGRQQRMDTQYNLCKKSDIVSECTGILGYIYKAVEYGHQSYGVLYCYLL